MRLCVSSPMIPADTLTRKAELARAWGYEAIAVFHPLEAWTPEIRKELLALESRTSVRPVEFVLGDDVYGQAMAEDSDRRSRCRAMYREAAEVCAELGAVTEIEYEYGPQDPLPLFEPFRQLDPQRREAFIEWYRELLRIVEGTEGRILLEPLNRYESRFLNRVADNISVLDEVAHPNAGLLPDTFHMSIEESDIGAAIRHAADRVVHVHLGDSNRLLPGHGLLDWHSIASALRAIGFDGCVNLECSTEGDPARTLPDAAVFLRDILAG